MADPSTDSETVIDLREERSVPRDRYLLSPPSVGATERDALLAAFDSGWIAPVGPQLDEFESLFADKLGADAAVALSSGTAALHMALRIVGVGEGDDVVVSSLTFAASANPVRYLGANPVFIDSELETWNMDPDLLAGFLLQRAKRNDLPAAVVVVDVLGQCAQLTQIKDLCDSYNIPIVEDAAEALGADHDGKLAGTFGRLGAFSFNGNKTITTSGGGMLIGSPTDIEKARYLSTQAREPVPWYEHRAVGYNYRLSNLLAGLGVAQLRRLDEIVASQRMVKERYRAELAGVPGIAFMPDSELGAPSNWLTAMTLDSTMPATEQVRQELERSNIEARAVWKPLHMQHAFAGCEHVGGSISEELFRTGLCLPSGTDLSAADIAFICSRLRSAVLTPGDVVASDAGLQEAS